MNYEEKKEFLNKYKKIYERSLKDGNNNRFVSDYDDTKRYCETIHHTIEKLERYLIDMKRYHTEATRRGLPHMNGKVFTEFITELCIVLDKVKECEIESVPPEILYLIHQ